MQLVNLNISIPYGKSSVDITIQNSFLENGITRKPLMHSHSKFELLFISGNNCVFTIADQDVPLEDGEILLIAPKTLHCTQQQLTNPLCHISAITFEISGYPESVAAVFSNFDAPYTVLKDNFGGNTRICRIQEEVKVQAAFFYEKICGEFASLLSDLARALQLGTQTVALPLRSMDQTRAEIIEIYLTTQYMSPTCSSKELADKLFLTQRQLYRVLMNHYGKSFRELLLQTRMENAEYALTHTDGTLETLAADIGYSSTSAFCQAYRNYYGKSPRFAFKEKKENRYD